MSRLMMVFIVAGCLVAAAAWGQSETAPADYPDPQCARPQVELIKPVNTYSNHIDDSAPVGSYNQKVRLYNSQARDYDACMHAYIDTANAALKRVQSDANDRIHQITNDANARLKMIEAKIAAAVRDANQVSRDEAEKHKQ
ncbi:MAG TPA: hypothetical protein VHC39_05265 [Rhizomicrobium sp.]|nr:hypothetical protein [Rhizomicrobium sp.]